MEKKTKITKTKDRPTKPITRECKPMCRVGLDPLDQLPFALIPETISQGTGAILAETINAINSEGSRGPALRRLLSRDIGLSRVQLRFRESLCNVELERLFRGGGDLKKVALAESLVAAQHRRLLSSIDRLARLEDDTGATARVSISNYAPVQFNVTPLTEDTPP